MLDELQRDLVEDLKDPEFAKAYGIESARSEFGLALFNARKKSQLTQKELADKIGVTQPYIAQLESGEINLTSDTLGKILAILGFKISAEIETLAPQKQPLIMDADLLKPGFLYTGYSEDMITAAATVITLQGRVMYIPNPHAVTPSTEILMTEPRLIPNLPKVEDPVCEAA